MPIQKTKIFLDSSDPALTKKVKDALGFIDGQTTNPSLVAKSPKGQKCFSKEEKCTKDELYELYKESVIEIANQLPSQGSVSIEVYADETTTAKEMIAEAQKLANWTTKAHIKLPTNKEGLQAAEELVAQGISINMTLVFSLEQAAAVYAATKGARKGDVYISPFIGRLDDKGKNGVSLIRNIQKLYKKGDGHVEVLAASIRNMDHIYAMLQENVDIMTIPGDMLLKWAKSGKKTPDDLYVYSQEKKLKELPYTDFDLEVKWNMFDVTHPQTQEGIKKFSADWNKLLGMENNKIDKKTQKKQSKNFPFNIFGV